MKKNNNPSLFEIYTPDEVAKKLSLNVRTIYKYIKEGKLAAAKIGKMYRITGYDLHIFLKIKNN